MSSTLMKRVALGQPSGGIIDKLLRSLGLLKDNVMSSQAMQSVPARIATGQYRPVQQPIEHFVRDTAARLPNVSKMDAARFAASPPVRNTLGLVPAAAATTAVAAPVMVANALFGGNSDEDMYKQLILQELAKQGVV